MLFYFIRFIFLICLCLTISGCESLGYWAHISSGHLSLLNKRTPIEKLLKNPHTPTQQKQKLAQTKTYLAFAQTELQLPSQGQYTHFVQLEGEYPIWSLVATPPLSLEPLTWCYPMIGCLSYRGFYRKEMAEAKAALLKNQDIYIAPATAYSTLGWFSDPILSNFLTLSDTQLAGLLFHELAHQKLYIKGDTTFNESFATAVEIEGVRRWTTLHHKHPELYARYLQEKKIRQAFVAMVQKTRTALAAIYQNTELSDPEKIIQKQQQILQLRAHYQTLKTTEWDNKGYFDQWFQGPLNNAQLSTIGTYHDWVDAFLVLLAENNHDMNAFYKASAQLGKEPKAKRTQRLQALMQKSTQKQ